MRISHILNDILKLQDTTNIAEHLENTGKNKMRIYI